MILGTEVNEFVTNRQQSKIHFLQQENNQLQEYINDLENALRLNKQAMRINVDNFQGNRKKNISVQDTSQSQSISTTYSNPLETKLQLEKYEQLIKHLNEENLNLVETLSRIQKTTTTTTTKALLQEQIAEETLNFYKDLIQDLEDKLIELKRNIHDKEYAIQELERMKPIQEREGQLFKVVEVVTPSEQTLKMHEELENIRSVLSKITQEAQLIAEQNKTLREVNYNLKREVYKLRIVLRSQVAHHTMKDFVYNEYIERTDQNLNLNQEIQSHRSKLEQLHQDMFGQGSLGYGFSPEPQQLKYLSKNERMIYQEKLHKMEMMLKGFRELFEKEKQISAQRATKYNDMIKQQEILIDTNELLIRSNRIKDERMQKLQNEQHFLKKQLNRYMEILKTRRHNYNPSVQLQQEQDIAVGVFSPRMSSRNTDSQKKPLFSAQRTQMGSVDFDMSNKYFTAIPTDEASVDRRTSEYQRQRITLEENASIIPNKLSKKPMLKALIIEDPADQQIEQANYCFTSRDQQPQKKKIDTIANYYDMTLQECKEFLVNMALEFNKSYSVQISNAQKIYLMNQIADVPQWAPRNRRSNSDPFGYFSKELEDEKITFKKPPRVSALHIVKSEIKVILEEINQQKQKRTTEYDPFNLDVSHIQDQKQQYEPISYRNKRGNVVIDAECSFISRDDGQESSEQDDEDLVQ